MRDLRQKAALEHTAADISCIDRALWTSVFSALWSYLRQHPCYLYFYDDQILVCILSDHARLVLSLRLLYLCLILPVLSDLACCPARLNVLLYVPYV